MKKSYFLLFLFVCFSLFGVNAIKTEYGFNTKFQNMQVEVSLYSPEIVRVVRYPEGTKLNKKSLSVIKTPGSTQFTYIDNELQTIIESSALKVIYNKNNGQFSFVNTSGATLFEEKANGAQFTPITDVNKQTYVFRQAYLLEKDEAIYGLGQHQNGKLNQRIGRINLKQDNMKISIPFIHSVKGYGLFWDNYAATQYTDNRQEFSFESMGDCEDYYFMYGKNADGVIAQMRNLTGQSPMIPLWAFGYNQSKERYKSQDELVSVVKKYRELQVPLDGIIQDWRYWGEDSNWNAMSFDARNYPEPERMVNEVHALNAHLMIVAWPGFGPQTKQYKELSDKKMMIKFDTWPPNSGTKPYDVYHPEARDIYWNYLNKGVFSKNTDAWWLDSTEPDHINVKESDFDQPTYLGSYRSVVNAFPLMHVGGIYDHQRATTSEKRVHILTRSAFAGQQRYAANSWSGDIVSSWETLQKQIPAALSLSLTAIPYWNADIGGFFLWNYNGSNAMKLKTYQELYVRWLQFGTFTPMMRSHGTDAPREIWQLGTKGYWAYDAVEKYIKLRYKLLPYIYSTAWEVSSQSGTFMRAMMMDFPDDKTTHDNGNQYLFGKNILVAPVTSAMYTSKKGNETSEDFTNIKSKKVYLPVGSRWVDFWTGITYDGGMEIAKETPVDIMPLYLKAGSILPWGPEVQFAEEKKWDNLEIRIYPGADGSFVLYEDENNNYNYEKGFFSTIEFKWDDKNKVLTIDKRKGQFNGMLKSRKFKVLVVGENNGTGDKPAAKYKTVNYKGNSTQVKL